MEEHNEVISTHSLTKRLTAHSSSDATIRSISTHSLTKRLTDLRHSFGSMLLHFNSQPHEEADFTGIVFPLARAYFNSQPHEEADEHFN